MKNRGLTKIDDYLSSTIVPTRRNDAKRSAQSVLKSVGSGASNDILLGGQHTETVTLPNVSPVKHGGRLAPILTPTVGASGPKTRHLLEESKLQTKL